MDCKFTKNVVTSVISLFANSNNCLGVRICSEKGLWKLARAVNLFKVPPTPSQAEKPAEKPEKLYGGILLS